MAKVGEGDPRWIVKERTDGANVNSWHWEERDLSKYTHQQMKDIFANYAIAEKESGVEYVRVEEVSEIAGDVTVAQRKGKMMCYFELKMTLKWIGKVAGADGEVRGKMEVAEVDHDEFKNDYDITVTCQESDNAAEALVRTAGRVAVRKEIEKYFDALFVEYHIGQAVKSGAAMPPPPPAPPTSTAAGEGSSKKSSEAASGEVTSFCWKMRWGGPIEEVFAALTDERRAHMYTRSPAKIDAKVGGQFTFLGGVISGYYVDLQAPTLIKQQWRLGSWPVGVHSSVVMQLTKEGPGVTLLEFAQSGIPAGQVQSVQEGWRANFFDAMKMVFGFSLQYI